MPTGWECLQLHEIESQDEKPGERWELSPKLGIDAFNLNVAILEPDERLSQNHFHYHKNQEELVHVVDGRCRIETIDDRINAKPGDTVRFEAGESGVHLVHNPFNEPCQLLAIGWPPEGRYPVEQVATLDELLDNRE